jgi:hypothetical protein
MPRTATGSHPRPSVIFLYTQVLRSINLGMSADGTPSHWPECDNDSGASLSERWRWRLKRSTGLPPVIHLFSGLLPKISSSPASR